MRRFKDNTLLKQAILIIGLVWGFGLFLPGTAAAHNPLHNQPVSPFEMIKAGDRAHCPLDKHPLTWFCPHEYNKETNGQRLLIGPDCGGNPNGPIPALSGFDKNPTLVHFSNQWNRAMKSYPFIISILFHSSTNPDSLEHPPRFI